MSDAQPDLGGRLPLIDPATLTCAQRTLWDRLDEMMVPWASRAGFATKTETGRFIGPFDAMLFSPELGLSFLDLQLDERRLSSLGSRVREVVILSVGAVWQADYELYAHSASAQSLGFSPQAIEALSQGRSCPELDGREALAQRVTLTLVRDRAVDDGLYREGIACLGEKGLVDLVVLAACYELICGLLNLFAMKAPGHAAHTPED